MEFPLGTIIEKETGIPTYIDNDSRAMAFGEFCCGVVEQEKDILFINIDHGVGLGIIINGEIYYGKSGFSGEFGHIPFFDNELICHCGKKVVWKQKHRAKPCKTIARKTGQWLWQYSTQQQEGPHANQPGRNCTGL